MKIGILNAYDARNMGDQAIVLAQIAWLKTRFPKAQFKIFSHHAKHNAPYFGDASLESVIHVPPTGPYLHRLFKPLCDWVAFRCFSHSGILKFEQFDSCDMFALCGGGYLYSSQSPILSRNLWVLCLNGLLAIKTGKPVIQFPQSFGPVTKKLDEYVVLKLARALKILVPRSEISLKFLQKAGLGEKSVFIPDIAFLLRHSFPDSFSTSYAKSGLGIAPIDFSFAQKISKTTLEVYVQKLIALGVQFHKDTGEAVTLFTQVSVTGMDDDSVVASRIEAGLHQQNVPVRWARPTHEFGDYMKDFQKVRVFVGSRMHACIFSLLAEIPTIGLAYQPKFYGLFKQLKLERWVAPIEGWTLEWARNLVSEVLRDESSLSLHIASSVRSIEDSIQERLATTFDPELKSLNGGEEGESEKGVEFSIVTPSYKQLDWLTLCAASIHDQEGVTFEHIIQDAGTGPAMLEWERTHPKSRVIVEHDSGMYDAINRGFGQAKGEIVAWLNCDEQYLPGTLAKVASFFAAHPDVDVVFGDAILISQSGDVLSYRRAILPSLLHIQLSHLNTLSCATFVRRSVLERGIRLRSEWKAIADAIWVADMMKEGIRMAVLNEPLSAFTITEHNLGQTSLAFTEMKRWRESSGNSQQWMRIPVIILHRVRKLLAGAYAVRRLKVELFTLNSPRTRLVKMAKRISFRWAAIDRENGKKDGGLISKTADLLKKSSPENYANLSGIDEPQRSFTWLAGVLIACASVAAILWVDSTVSGVVVTPMLSVLLLLLFAFYVPPASLSMLAVLLTGVVYYALRYGQPFHPDDPTDWMRLIVRISSFLSTSLLAIFFSAYRLRSQRHLAQTFSILKQMPAPIIVSDAAGYITFANEAAAKFLGSSLRDIAGQQYVRIITSYQNEGDAMRSYIDFFENPIAHSEETLLLQREQGLYPISAKLICIGSSENRYLVTVLSEKNTQL